MTDLAGKYRNYRLLSPFRNEIYTSEPDNVDLLKGLLGDGIFTVDGDKWRQQRKVSSYEFSTKVSRDFSSVVFRENAAKLATIVSEAANSNEIMDIQIKRFLNIGSEATLKKSRELVDNFVYKLIHSKIEPMRNSKDEASIMQMKKEDILSRFLQVSDTDPTYLRDIILNFIIAGKDTTTATLSWFIYMLCKHPDVQEKVAQEVKEATDTMEVKDFAEFAAILSEEALGKMHYLHAALTETLRLYPAVPVDAKICLSDETLPDGFSVRKGDMVCYQPYAMGRMKFIWGDDAEEFRPERCLDEEGMFQPESPFKFTAFQAGPRICLGKEFAYRQMKIFSAVLVHCFAFKLSDENKSVTYRTMINLHVDGGLHVRALHRCQT
ncbi:hypothetical protein SCA6_015261 [Theobroma cacao]